MLFERPLASEPGIQIPVLPLTSCVIFGISLNLPEPQIHPSVKE